MPDIIKKPWHRTYEHYVLDFLREQRATDGWISTYMEAISYQLTGPTHVLSFIHSLEYSLTQRTLRIHDFKTFHEKDPAR